MKCHNCGADIPDGHLYCDKCGAEINIVPEFEPEVENEIDTTLSSIALSVFVTNLFAIPAGNIFLLYFAESESGSDSIHFIEFEAA